MTLDEIEEMIKKYISTGIAVVVVLVAPGTKAGDPAVPSGSLPPGSQVITVEPDKAASAAASAGSDSGGATGPGDRTGAAGTDPGTSPGGDSTPDGAGSPADSGRPASGSGGSGSDQKSGSDTSGSDGSASGSDETSESSGSQGKSGGTGNSGTGNSDGSDNGGNADNTGKTGNAGNDAGPDSSRDTGEADNTGKSSGSGNSGSASDPGGSGNSGSAGNSGNSGNARNDTGTDTTGTAAPDTSGGAAQSTTGDGTTAAAKLGWGTPDREDDFSNGAGQWGIYDGAGHGGKGTRSPSAVSTTGGVLTITGDSSGTTAGMAWLGSSTKAGQKYGRWEGRVKAPASDPSYNALLLLWPDAENWPTGGEVDFMEMSDPSRQETNMFLHYGADNQQTSGKVQIDATQWHNWALEWTPDAITAYVDGQEWYRTTDKNTFPPGPMHLCIQLDWFPQGGSAKESTMQVDWVRQYPVDGSTSGGTSTGSGNSSGSGTSAGTGATSGQQNGSGQQGGADQQSGGNNNGDTSNGADNATDNSNAGGDSNDTGGDSPVRNVLRRMFSWG